MVTVTVSAAGKPPAVAKKLPITVQIDGKSIDNATIGDVKNEIKKQFPKVSMFTHPQIFVFISLKIIIFLSPSSPLLAKRSL